MCLDSWGVEDTGRSCHVVSWQPNISQTPCHFAKCRSAILNAPCSPYFTLVGGCHFNFNISTSLRCWNMLECNGMYGMSTGMSICLIEAYWSHWLIILWSSGLQVSWNHQPEVFVVLHSYGVMWHPNFLHATYTAPCWPYLKCTVSIEDLLI